MTAMPLCDCAISMDADQDDINVIDRFVEKYMEGCDVVYGVRNSARPIRSSSAPPQRAL